MSTTVLLLVLVALFVFYLYKKKATSSSDFKELTMSPSERVIRVYSMDKEQLEKAIEDFSNISDNLISSISREDDTFRITFKPTTGYIDFCYWVNYLVYSDEEKNQRYKVYGWYPFGEVEINGEKQPFSNQTVMMYVDKDDTEHDNISFVTPDGRYYLQPFAIGNNLKPRDTGTENYSTIQ